MPHIIPPIFVQYSFDLPPRPLHSIILYRSEVWSITKFSKRNLITFENEVQRKTFGTNTWGGECFFEKRKNRELRESYINPDNIAIKKQTFKIAEPYKKKL